ncbi:MAG: hypothetical protein AAFO68_10245 [Pseudomonadota bacterium]
MFSFVFKIVGLTILALALVLAVLDVTRSITASEIVLTPLAQTWATISPSTLDASRQFIVGLGLPWLWDPLVLTLMRLPSWLIFWLVSMLLMWSAQRRDNPYGRFARR